MYQDSPGSYRGAAKKAKKSSSFIQSYDKSKSRERSNLNELERSGCFGESFRQSAISDNEEDVDEASEPSMEVVKTEVHCHTDSPQTPVYVSVSPPQHVAFRCE